jgi:hypothetical protein
MGTGIKSEATAKSEKKANTIMPFMLVRPRGQNFGFNLLFVFFKGDLAIINLVV